MQGRHDLAGDGRIHGAGLEESGVEIEMAEGRVRVLRTQTTESGRDTGRPDLG
nr:hypothetical protein [Gordonia bronchialis]